MPYKQEPSQAGKLQNEGKNTGQNSGKPKAKLLKSEFSGCQSKKMHCAYKECYVMPLCEA
jgi:hypothetical protein